MNKQSRFKIITVCLMIICLAFNTMTITPTNIITAATDVTIMPLGDSITDGYNVPGGYRIDLWSKYVAAGKSIDFVGSMSNGPTNLPDKNHEGHSGWRIDEINNYIESWLNTYNPSIVMLQIGTNDLLQNYNISTAPSRLSALIDKITNTKPSVKLFVASLTPINNTTNEQRVLNFNATIPGIVSQKVSQGKSVYYVNMHDALTLSDLADGIHPNATGYSKMATVWYNATVNHIDSSVTPTPTPIPGGDTVHSGSWGIKVVVSGSPSWSNFYQSKAVTANTNYSAYFWMKGTGKVRFKVVSNNWSTTLATQEFSATSTWTQYYLPTFNTGSNTTVNYVFSDGGNTAGTFYIDDCFLGLSGGANILTNPGLESGNTGWNDESPQFSIIQSTSSPTATPTATPTPTAIPTVTPSVTPTPTPTATPTPTPTPAPAGGTVHSGTWSAKAVLSGSPTWNNFYQSCNLSSNTNYVASFWLKGSGKIRLRIMTSNWSTTVATQEFTATSTWTQYSLPTFNSGNNTSIWYVFSDSGNTAGTIYIDDCFLGVSGGTNILNNPGYESGNTGWNIDSSIFSIIQGS